MKKRDLFFNFGTFDEEIEKKIISRGLPVDDLMGLFLHKLCRKGISVAAFQKIERLYWGYLRNVPSEEGKPHYLSHPIRVAAVYIEYLETVSYEDLALVLCHNLKEKSEESYRVIDEALVSREVKSEIKRLTIDRNREKDKAYLEKFYNGIEQAPKNLMLLKALDKLDNTLIWVLLDLERYHADIVLDFVCPRIERAYPKLKVYLRGLTYYVLTEEAKNRFKNIPTVSSQLG